MRGYFPTEAGRIYYEFAGKGPAVVLLHDGIAHREVFVAQFRTLSEQYRVVRFDHRGFGLSDPASASYVEHEDLAQLLDHIGVEHASFIAGSAAAGEALDFVLAYPPRVNRLILVGPSVRGLEFSAHFVARNRANSAPILKDDPTPEDVRRAHENWLRDPWVLAGDDARARLRTLLEPYVDKHGARRDPHVPGLPAGCPPNSPFTSWQGGRLQPRRAYGPNIASRRSR